MDDGYFEITMLIGADYYWSIVEDNVIRGDGPTAVQSKLGYLLSGPVAGYNQKSHTPLMMNILASHTQEEVDLEKFWKAESLAFERIESDRNSDIYLADYQSSSITYQDGKYYEKLPCKDNHPVLPTNEEITKRRTQQVIFRLKNICLCYKFTVISSESKSCVDLLKRSPTSLSQRYISYRIILWERNLQLPSIRIVYDCSCKLPPTSTSLKDCLINTPPNLNDITTLLLRFRSNKYGIHM